MSVGCRKKESHLQQGFIRILFSILPLILSACEVEFEAHLTPLVIGTFQATTAFGAIGTQIPY
jgi:hypothetical protein